MLSVFVPTVNQIVEKIRGCNPCGKCWGLLFTQVGLGSRANCNKCCKKLPTLRQVSTLCQLCSPILQYLSVTWGIARQQLTLSRCPFTNGRLASRKPTLRGQTRKRNNAFSPRRGIQRRTMSLMNMVTMEAELCSVKVGTFPMTVEAGQAREASASDRSPPLCSSLHWRAGNSALSLSCANTKSMLSVVEMDTRVRGWYSTSRAHPFTVNRYSRTGNIWLVHALPLRDNTASPTLCHGGRSSFA